MALKVGPGRGRKRKPTELLRIEGNPGKRPLNEREPRPDRVRPNPPPGMSRVGKKIWEYYADVLDRMNILTEADLTVLQQFCEMTGEAILYQKLLEREGRFINYTIMDPAGNEKPVKKSHPAEMRLEKRREQIKSYSSLLGLNPSARAGLKLSAVADEDELEKFLKGNNGKKT